MVSRELGAPCKIWEYGLVDRLDEPCRGPEPYAGKVNFDEYLSAGVKLFIPAMYLFGTQERGEFEVRKRKSVEEKLKRCGVACLIEHPIPVCALPEQEILTLAIIDGHHRVRYSGNYNMHVLPCVVYTPEQLVDIINQNYVYEHPIAVRSFIVGLRENVIAAQASFANVMPARKNPKVVHMESIVELQHSHCAF